MIDEEFINYVETTNPYIFHYFACTESIYDGFTHEEIDLYHWAATLSAILYNTSTKDYVNNGGTIIDLAEVNAQESIFDDLAGWAGDLQSHVMDVKKRYREYVLPAVQSDYLSEGFENLVEMGIGESNSKFSNEDLLADIDAYIIGNRAYLTQGIFVCLKNYYEKGSKYRFSTYVDIMSNTKKDIFSKKVLAKTKYKYAGVKIWPLYRVPANEVQYYDDITVRDFEATGAADAFVDYIWSRF